MRTKAILIVVLVIGTSASQTFAKCGFGNGSLLKVESISAEQKPGMTLVEVRYVNTSPDIIRIAHATLVVEDVLGVDIGNWNLALDEVLLPRVPASVSFPTSEFDRLLKMRPEDVDASLCVTAVLYEDGRKMHY